MVPQNFTEENEINEEVQATPAGLRYLSSVFCSKCGSSGLEAAT
jgi:hypothetical protein